MNGVNTKSLKNMGDKESKEVNTQGTDALPLSKIALQDPTVTSTGVNKHGHLESSVSIDAVPLNGTDSGYSSIQPEKSNNYLEIAEWVGKETGQEFDPFKRDISERDDEMKKKIEYFKKFMDFDLEFGYCDAMILFHDDDVQDVKKFRASIDQNVLLNNNQKPKIALFSDLALSRGNMFRALEFGVERCTFIMLYITSNFVNCKWSEYSSETCLMDSIYNPSKRWSVVPVFTNDKSSYRIPLSINTLKGVRYSSEESFYLDSITNLFNASLNVRMQHEKEHLQKQIKWVHEFEEKAREEALEKIKRDNLRKAKHERFIRKVEQEGMAIHPSSTNFIKENIVNEFIDNSKHHELSVAQKNKQLKQLPVNMPISKPDEESESGTSVDPQDKDLVADTPSPVKCTSAPILGQGSVEHCSSDASSSCHQPPMNVKCHHTASDPLVSNIALAGQPLRSSFSNNHTPCPPATSEDLTTKNKPINATADNYKPAGIVHQTVKSNIPGSQSAIHSSASSNYRPQSRSGEQQKSYIGISASCIDHSLSEKSDSQSAVHHHHHYYTNPPVYNIKAENVQIGSENRLYNVGQSGDSDEDYESYERSSKGKYNSDSSDEPETSRNSYVSTPSQDGAQDTGSHNTNNNEVLQQYGINPHNPRSTMGDSDPDQTRVKVVANVTTDNRTNGDPEETKLKGKVE